MTLPSFLSFDNSLALAVAAGVSFIGSGMIYATRWRHGWRSARPDTLGAVQSAHVAPTPRLGGASLVLGLAAAAIVSADHFGWRAAALWLSLAPIVVAGLLEDLGFRIRPLVRLLAAAASSMIAVALTDRWLVRFDAPVLDLAMQFAPLAILVTVFATTAVSHAFNLIDGLNGLASAVAITTALAFAAIAMRADDPSSAAMAQVFCAAVVGFFLWNYPFGRIFLGDAGAYALGHALSWFAVAFVWRSPEASAWALLLLFLWPVADTTLAIWRRLRRGAPLAAPDNRHMHQVVLRAVEACWLGRGRRHVANPVATLVMAPFFVMPTIVGVVVWNSVFWSFIAVVVFAALFVSTYGALVWAIPRFRLRRPRAQAVVRPSPGRISPPEALADGSSLAR